MRKTKTVPLYQVKHGDHVVLEECSCTWKVLTGGNSKKRSRVLVPFAAHGCALRTPEGRKLHGIGRSKSMANSTLVKIVKGDGKAWTGRKPPEFYQE